MVESLLTVSVAFFSIFMEIAIENAEDPELEKEAFEFLHQKKKLISFFRHNFKERVEKTSKKIFLKKKKKKKKKLQF